jgi:peptide/nickel transport system ATP-binding protein
LSDTVLSVRLDAGYGSQPILNGVHFDLRQGERMGLVGSSGAGKSTLVLALMGLLPWRRGWAMGKVLLEGRDILAMKEKEARHVRGKRFALVPQSPTSALNNALSLRAHFEEAWRAHEHGGSVRFKQRLNQLMDQIHLPFDDRFLARKPGEISVGQAQRVVLALALLHRPAVLIADEPTSALDPVTQMEILDLLREINHDDGTALLYISHDLLSVLQLCESMAILHEGSIAECVAVNEIAEKAHHPATLSLLRTLPAPPEVLRANARWSTAAAITGVDCGVDPRKTEEPIADSDVEVCLQLRSNSDAHR